MNSAVKKERNFRSLLLSYRKFEYINPPFEKLYQITCNHGLYSRIGYGVHRKKIGVNIRYCPARTARHYKEKSGFVQKRSI